ncbi:MAG: DUF2272 domain-containing protein [Ideonella sp.]
MSRTLGRPRTWAIRTSLSLLALLLASCAGLPPPPPRTPVAPTVVSAARIERLIVLLDQEWTRWGRIVNLVPVGTDTCVPHGDGYCDVIEDGCGQEKTADLCPLVDGYWSSIRYRKIRHSCRRTDICEIQWPAGEPPPERTPPWSAAFVSAMMQRAGFSTTEFLPAPSHADYVVAARDGFMSAFAVVATPATVNPGDLICAVRGNSELTPDDIAQITDRQLATPMHCDIVVRVDRGAHSLEAIGGNVQQTVAKSIVALDAVNQVRFDLNPDRPWVLVMRARR